MAQETAGTIGIPVLKNEVLPYLTDYAKRQERAQLYKQKAEQRAAELAAKKAAEDAKFKSEIKPTEGGMLMSQIQQLNKADIEVAQKKFADQNTSLQEKYELSNNLNRIIDERNAYQKYNEGLIKSQLPEMQKYYQVDESDIPVYSSGFKADPSIFNVNHVAQFKSAIEDDPNRFKWRDVGSSLFKTVGADKYSFTNSAGQQEVIEANNLFIPEVVTNPVTGRKVTAQKLNADVAMDVAMGNPKVWKAVTTYAQTRVPKLIEDVAVANQAAKLGVDANKYAQSIAQEEALNKLFSNMGGVTYSKDIQTEQQRARAQAKGQKLAELAMSNQPSTSQVYVGRGAPEPGFPKGKVLYSQVSWGSVPTFTIPRTSIPGGANKKVYPLSNPAEFQQIFTQFPNGTYGLKQGFEVDSGQLVMAAEAKEDIPLKSGGKKKKGSLLTPEFIKTMTPAQQNQYVRNFEAYKLTPQILSYKYDEENETYDMKSPQVKTVELLIPKDYAGEITNVLDSGKEQVNFAKSNGLRIKNYQK
jgi:hypothetical protein